MAFVQAAVYNAVVGIEGRYAPYRFTPTHPRHLGPGGRGRRRPRDPGDLRAVRAGHPGRRLRRVAGADSRRHGEDPRHRVRHPRRRQPDPAARPRRPQCPHPVHPAAGTGRLAAHPAGVLPMSAPWIAFVTPLLVHSATQFAPPTPPALTSARYTRDFNEVKATRFAHLDRADGGADEHRAVLLRQRPGAVQRHVRGPGDRAAPGHRRRRPDVRRDRHERRGRGNLRVARKVHSRTVAADHRDQPGRHRRQPEHGPDPSWVPLAEHPHIRSTRAGTTHSTPP